MALTDLFGKLLVRAATVIRRQTAIPFLVNRVTEQNDATTPYIKGGKVNFIVPPEFATRDVTPAATPPASASPTVAETTVECGLDYWKEVNFSLSGAEVAQLEDPNTTAMLRIDNAAGTLVEAISTSILANYTKIYGAVGTAGTTPYASSPAAAQAAMVLLTNQKCPRFMRQMLLNPSGYGNAIALDQMSAEKRGDGVSTAIRDFRIPHAYGMDWWEEMMIPTHTAGGGSGYLVNQADVAIGDTDVTTDTGSGTLVAGDIFTVAGDTQQYVVVSTTGGSSVTNIVFQPAAKVAWANNAAITKVASHTVNLAFHPYAFGFASRPEKRTNLLRSAAGTMRMSYRDPMTDLVLTLEGKEEYHQEGWYLSCLWGTKLVDPRLAVRVLG